MIRGPYVFVCEDGQVFRTTDEPTPEDLEQAAVGIVTILRLNDQHFFGRAAEWRPILEGECGVAEIEGNAPRPFHAPAAYFGDDTKQ